MRNFSVWLFVACVLIVVVYATPNAEPEPEALANAEPIAEPQRFRNRRNQRRQARRNSRVGQVKQQRTVQKKASAAAAAAAAANSVKPKKTLCNCAENPDCGEHCKTQNKYVETPSAHVSSSHSGGDYETLIEAPTCPGIYPIPYPVDDLKYGNLYGYI